MAAKKHKLTRKRRQKLVSINKPLTSILIGLLIGVAVTSVINRGANGHTPDNLVWAAHSDVVIPKSLKHVLLTRKDCQHNKGDNSEKDVGLWAVYQTSESKFAKIAYGCSWSLSSYIMAVKQDKNWILLPPADYFAAFKDSPQIGNGALPKCEQLEKYKINKNIEPFCILSDGSAKINEQT